MPAIFEIHRTEYEIEDDRSVTVAAAQSPGRIHFLGEQCDPKSSFYLSAAIDRYINVAVSFRKDNSFRFFASDLGERKRSTLANLKYRREDRWANYLKTAIFLFIDLGFQMRGLNFSFSGDIPQNIGLATSTAIEVAAACALRNLFRLQINDNDLAQKLMSTHSALFGQDASLVDYQVCFFARKDHFLVFDSSSGVCKTIPSPLARFRILLVDSRVPKLGAESELASRHADALKGLEYLSRKQGGAAFRDFASTDLLEALGDFPEQIRRRSMHIVEEIGRVNDASDALERSDIASLAKIIFYSHESLRDLYEISCPEVDWLVKRAQEIEGAAGSRMTGHGFGGCTYTIIRRELVEEYKKRLEEYERIFGFRPFVYEVKLSGCARAVPERRRVNANTAH
ncbi:MAG: galactokinase [Treponema sp.]|jgi:galactokinase|nr:galactokinase [Treponema sp.]